MTIIKAQENKAWSATRDQILLPALEGDSGEPIPLGGDDSHPISS